MAPIITAASNMAVCSLRKRHIIAFGLVFPLMMTNLLSVPSASNSFALSDTAEKAPGIAAICLIVSNEEYYLDEWLDYHLGLGFHHIFIYDNSGDLGNGWLDRRPRLHSKVTVQYYPGEDKQGVAYQHCGQYHLLGKYRWVGLFDADEYLVLKKHPNVIAFLTEYCKEGSISLSWQLHSWNGQLQYSPEPVTKRFQGMHSIDQHVKTISNVDAVDWAQVPHPHYTFLKDGFRQLDTRGEEISPKWQNLRFPSEVAVFFHHHCKSHKEYIAKRSRGRATMSGAAHVKSRNELIQKAKNKVGFHNNTRIDPLAWNTLKSVSVKYSLYDASDLHFQLNKSATVITNTVSNAICTVASDDEAYVDEWVDYHAAIGFSKLYVFDSTEEHWFQQWGKEKSISAPIEVTHLPGNKAEASYKAEVFTKCIELHHTDHHYMVFLEVNDFIVIPNSDGLEPLNELVKFSSDCAHPLQRTFFGNAGQAVYDPLPVTKRFMQRVEDDLLSPQSAIVIKTQGISAKSTLKSDMVKYFSTHKWGPSSACSGNSTSTPSEIVAHHYFRSTKECKKERGSTDLCSLKGTVEDQAAWKKLTKLLPGYSRYDGFL